MAPSPAQGGDGGPQIFMDIRIGDRKGAMKFVCFVHKTTPCFVPLSVEVMVSTCTVYLLLTVPTTKHSGVGSGMCTPSKLCGPPYFILQVTVVSDAWLGALRLLEQVPNSAFRSALVRNYRTYRQYRCNSVVLLYLVQQHYSSCTAQPLVLCPPGVELSKYKQGPDGTAVMHLTTNAGGACRLK